MNVVTFLLMVECNKLLHIQLIYTHIISINVLIIGKNDFIMKKNELVIIKIN